MEKLTRRKLIKRASLGAGAAGVLTAAVATGFHFEAANAQTSKQATNTSSEPLVACINDATSGNIVLMRGQNEITIHNPALVQSLLSL